jgi:hypothetical protein
MNNTETMRVTAQTFRSRRRHGGASLLSAFLAVSLLLFVVVPPTHALTHLFTPRSQTDMATKPGGQVRLEPTFGGAEQDHCLLCFLAKSHPYLSAAIFTAFRVEVFHLVLNPQPSFSNFSLATPCGRAPPAV